MTEVVVAADARPEVGLGHLSRCTALAGALTALGAEVTAVALGAAEPLTLDGVGWAPGALPAAGAVVFDVYGDDAAAHGVTAPVAVFDDGQALGTADLRVAPAAPAIGGARLAGLDYAVLRRDYWGLAPVAPPAPPPVHRVLVSVGGGPLDPAPLCAAAVAGAPGAAIVLVRGRGANGPAPAGVEVVEDVPSLAAELARADLVVCAAGQTALEAAAAGTPAVVVALADNQRPNAAALAAAGAARVVEDAGAVADAVARLAADPAARAGLAAAGRHAVDGHGAFRVARAVLELAERGR